MFGLGPLFQMSKEKTHSTTNMFLANKLRGYFRAIAKSNLKRNLWIVVYDILLLYAAGSMKPSAFSHYRWIRAMVIPLR